MNKHIIKIEEDGWVSVEFRDNLMEERGLGDIGVDVEIVDERKTMTKEELRNHIADIVNDVSLLPKEQSIDAYTDSLWTRLNSTK